MNTVSVRFDGKVVAVPGRENNVEFFNFRAFKEIDEKEESAVLGFGTRQQGKLFGGELFTKRKFLAAYQGQKVHRLEREKEQPIVVLNVSDTNVCSMDWIEGENALS